ncbi:MAG: hypothetical protein EBR82_54925 [Caulobacteraceae bacterium]|nr:hypothetical protein [Caulobacteraceae bacterium]
MMDGSEVNALIQKRKDDQLAKTIAAQTQPQIDALQKKLNEATSQENFRNSLAQQIAALSGGGQTQQAQTLYAGGTPNFNEATGQYMNQPVVPAGLSASALDAISGGISQLALAQNPAITALSAGNSYATSPLANKLNFQVSDQQILDDYNNTKLGRLNSIVQQGNTQVAGIQQRLTAAQTLLNQLPKNDPRYTSSKVYVDQLNADLKSVTDAITGANKQIKDFKPIAVGSPEAASEITSFREYLQLPEERATQQLRQIDPKSYETAVALGQRYRQMATAPIGETKSAQTEQLRSNLEQEALNQLALGSQLGAEEQRQYQQVGRKSRGNISRLLAPPRPPVATSLELPQRSRRRLLRVQPVNNASLRVTGLLPNSLLLVRILPMRLKLTWLFAMRCCKAALVQLLDLLLVVLRSTTSAKHAPAHSSLLSRTISKPTKRCLVSSGKLRVPHSRFIRRWIKAFLLTSPIPLRICMGRWLITKPKRMAHILLQRQASRHLHNSLDRLPQELEICLAHSNSDKG